MRHDKLVPGAILITIGVIFLLRSLGIVHIHWINILHLWPIFLVIGGINLIFAHNRSPWASVLKIGVVVAGVLILLFGSFNDRFSFWPHTYYSYHNDKDDDNDNNDNNSNDDSDDNNNHKDITKIEGNSSYTEPYNAGARIAKLNITGGGTSYRLSDTTNQLFQAFTREFNGRYEFSRHTDADSVYVLDFNMKKNSHFHWDKDKSNTVNFKLNTNPIWDMDIQTGATSLDFDLTKFKIRNLEINGGAASFEIKLGEPLEATKLDISTGVSEVKINIPKDAACKIDTDSGLSSNNFNGFNKTDDNHYETPGFSAAKKKIYIKLDGGISDFKVNRY